MIFFFKPGVRFSKVLVTFRARRYILKSKSIEWWCNFSPANQPGPKGYRDFQEMGPWYQDFSGKIILKSAEHIKLII